MEKVSFPRDGPVEPADSSQQKGSDRPFDSRFEREGFPFEDLEPRPPRLATSEPSVSKQRTSFPFENRLRFPFHRRNETGRASFPFDPKGHEGSKTHDARAHRTMDVCDSSDTSQETRIKAWCAGLFPSPSKERRRIEETRRTRMSRGNGRESGT